VTLYTYTMKYTHYLSTTIKNNGLPNLGHEGFATLMNIVHLEGAKLALEKMREREAHDITKHRYDIWINSYEVKLESLTCGFEPRLLMRQLVQE
jgi:hypothetical protein